jgi:hypothetical protein
MEDNMGYWNYRFVKIKNMQPFSVDDEYIYQLCEVYYDDDGKPYGFCDAGPVFVENPEERFEIACWISRAAIDDVLDANDMEESDWDDDRGDFVLLSNTESFDDFIKELNDDSES